MKSLLLPILIGAFSVISAGAVPRGLLEKLDADQFATRSKAQEDLMKWAKEAKQDEIKELKKVYEGAESPEVKMRLLDVIENTTFEAEPNTRGFVGISMKPHIGGVGIDRVEPNTPANKVDLRVGDIIIEVDNIDLRKKKAHEEEAMMFFGGYVKRKNAGQKLELKIKRKDEIIEKTLKLGDYDKFNRQFLQQPPQQFMLQNGRQLHLDPNVQLQMQIVPQGAKPNINELRKALELQRNELENNKKELKKLRLKLEKQQEK